MEKTPGRILVVPRNLHPLAFPARPRIEIEYFHRQPGGVDPLGYLRFAYSCSPSEHPTQANKHLEIYGGRIIIFIHW